MCSGLQARLQLCGDAASGRSQHRHPSARLQGNDEWRQLSGGEEQRRPLPAQRELHRVGRGAGHHREEQPAALQRHRRPLGDPAGREAPGRSPDGGGAVCGPDDSASDPLLLLHRPAEQGGQGAQEGRPSELQQRPGRGRRQGKKQRDPEDGLQQGRAWTSEMDIHTLGPVLGDLRHWDPEEDGAVSEAGWEAWLWLRSFTKTPGHQGLWRPVSWVAGWAVVALLQKLWKGLQEKTAELQNPKRAYAAKRPLHRPEEATGAGLL